MSLIDEVKKMAGDAIARGAQELISDNAEHLVGNFIKEQLKSGNSDQIQQIITELIGDQGSIGGLKSLVNKFNAVNLGSLIQSWIGSGQNAPISMQQVESVFGEDLIRMIAHKTGINATILTGLISQFLPSLVDTVTKDGRIVEGLSNHKINVTELLTSLIK